jgi:hypothetical protein
LNAGEPIVKRFENSQTLVYGWLFSVQQQKRLERIVVKVSVASFLIHLFLVLLARSLPHPDLLIEAVGKSYLAAIYTPFSFILFYEALMLIAAIPKSTTRSIAKQFEIVSLIFIRKFFKDIAHLADIGKLESFSPEVRHVLIDVSAGLCMFLLVTVFLQAAQKRLPQQEEAAAKSAELVEFIKQKELIALGLTATFLVLVVSNLWAYFHQVYGYIYFGGVQPDPNNFFYTDLFAVMIFTDVLIVILSISVSDSYELVFRNEAFVISTILLRFSLTVAPPWGDPLALAGIAFGIVAVLIYNYNVQMRWPKAKAL